MTGAIPCPEWANDLAARSPEDLTPARREALAQHLLTCQRCLQVHRDYEALTARVQGATQEDRFLGLTHQLAHLRHDLIRQQHEVPDHFQEDLSATKHQGSIPVPLINTVAHSEYGLKGASMEEGLLPITDDVRLHYQILGSGSHSLLIPAVRWPLIACQELLQQHTLVFYDRHQRNISGNNRSPLGASILELEMLSQHLNLSQIALVGWSRFSSIATHYALEHAERITRLLLVRPVSSHLARGSSWDEAASEEIELAKVSSLHTPTLIIHGMNDPFPLSSSQAWAAALPNARLLAMAGVGSSPWKDAPGNFFTAVSQFLTGSWPQGAVAVNAKSA